MRYKVTLAYNGKNYAGFQSQKNALAIQDVIESVLEKIFSKKIHIVISSRTDAGVHAKGQVFHFDIDQNLDLGKLKFSLNSLLPKDIHIIDIKKVSDDFHCRYSVKKKTYEYLINTGEYDVFLLGYAYQINYKLDVKKMAKAAKLLKGTHDFFAFNTTPLSEKPNQVRTIYEFKIIEENNLIRIRVTADGFLRNMVRIMVGMLVDIGRGNRQIEEIEELLNNPTRSTRRFNIDPNGLYLMKIFY